MQTHAQKKKNGLKYQVIIKCLRHTGYLLRLSHSLASGMGIKFNFMSQRKETTIILNLLLQNTSPTLAAKLLLHGATFSPLDSLEKESNIRNVLSELSVFQWTREKLHFKEIERRKTTTTGFTLRFCFLRCLSYHQSHPNLFLCGEKG